MKLEDYLRLEAESNQRQHDIYLARNKSYASEDDCLSNDKDVVAICLILGLDFTRPEDASWFRLVDKLVRERNNHKLDNLDDAINYLRRIMAHHER